jgi:hypothetical protein
VQSFNTLTPFPATKHRHEIAPAVVVSCCSYAFHPEPAVDTCRAITITVVSGINCTRHITAPQATHRKAEPVICNHNRSEEVLKELVIPLYPFTSTMKNDGTGSKNGSASLIHLVSLPCKGHDDC